MYAASEGGRHKAKGEGYKQRGPAGSRQGRQAGVANNRAG